MNGAAVSGRLFVLMGPSGAGKTSLLDILARVPVVGKATGSTTLDGTIVGPAASRGTGGLRSCLPCGGPSGGSGDGEAPRGGGASARTCYVQQRDVLMPSATVRATTGGWACKGLRPCHTWTCCTSCWGLADSYIPFIGGSVLVLWPRWFDPLPPSATALGARIAPHKRPAAAANVHPTQREGGARG